MAWVEVWLENTEAIRWGRRNERGEIVFDLFPAQEKLVGRCKATPEAVAALAGVGKELAAEALSKMGEPVFIGAMGQKPVDFYLVVYPYQKRSHKRK